MKNMRKEGPPWAPLMKRVVNVIFGGVKHERCYITASKKLSKVSITCEKCTQHTLTREEISFSDEEVDGLIMPYND